MFRNILTGAAVIALISGATAQQKQQVSVKKAVTPQYAGTFSPLTGFVDAGNSARIGTSHVINNSILSNYYSIPGANQEWIDNNILTDTDGTGAEIVDGCVYTYCSSDLNPNGMTEVVTIYDDSVYCSGPVNWPVADCGYGVAGLPGAVNGSLACWIVTIDLVGMECNLTDGGGSAGWGQIWDNSTTGPWLASGGNGQTDSFTWFDTNTSTFQGCYWFTGTPWAGFDMQMFAADDTGLTLSTPDTPGGAMTFNVTGATPGGLVALMYAQGHGSHVIQNVTTGLSSVGFNIADISPSSAIDGSYSFTHPNVPSGAAGVYSAQAGDVVSLGLSNVLDL